MKKTLLFVISIFFVINIFSQNIELSNRLIDQYKNNQQKSKQKNTSVTNHLWLTPLLKVAVNNWQELTQEAKDIFAPYLQRPTFSGTEQTITSGNFVIHFTTDSGYDQEDVPTTDNNSNSIPDYIDSVISKFTKVYNLYHTSTELTVPPQDGTAGGNAKYDVYISGDEAGDGVYGYVAPETNIGNNPNSSGLTEIDAYTSFMVLRNNYIGYGNEDIALSVTTAHEYMHATQFGYTGNMDSWFMEACATWSEDYVFSGFDDNFQYLSEIFSTPDVALDISDTELSGTFDSHWYGAWIWVRFMTEHSNNSIIKNIYENCIDYYAFQAIDMALNSFALNFNDLFKNFAIANRIMHIPNIPAQYTYARAYDYDNYLSFNDLYNYETTLSYTGTNLSFNSNTQGNQRLMRNSVDYIKINSTQNFQLTFTKADPNANYDIVLLKIGNNSVEVVDPVHQNNNSIVTLNDYSLWNYFVVAVIRFDGTANNQTENSKQYTIAISQYVGLENIKQNFAIYPNPASQYIVIDGKKEIYNKVEITDINGKKVYEIRATDKSNKIDISKLQKGIYFVSLLNNDKLIKTEKIAIN